MRKILIWMNLSPTKAQVVQKIDENNHGLKNKSCIIVKIEYVRAVPHSSYVQACNPSSAHQHLVHVSQVTLF